MKLKSNRNYAAKDCTIRLDLNRKQNKKEIVLVESVLKISHSNTAAAVSWCACNWGWGWSASFFLFHSDPGNACSFSPCWAVIFFPNFCVVTAFTAKIPKLKINCNHMSISTNRGRWLIIDSDLIWRIKSHAEKLETIQNEFPNNSDC